MITICGLFRKKQLVADVTKALLDVEAIIACDYSDGRVVEAAIFLAISRP